MSKRLHPADATCDPGTRTTGAWELPGFGTWENRDLSSAHVVGFLREGGVQEKGVTGEP